ncbi:hypothetical protein K457DRAFT_153102 [Linnemannia elongata AG-77]|uniref:Uncharacterized protein n=1 Tax=Linnemannia elongata AG-77 TaxID=1314771 RepID=A0A197K9H6_9FUNG|nr:hypothetical protein K457DRAFT_153102 [Linnemannia elongata AG-77]
MPSTTTHNPTSSSTPTIPVLISGAGPVGLYEALLLTQLGIPVRIIDRDTAISPNSRALGLHARSLEIFQFTGTVDDFLERGQGITNLSYYMNARLVGSLPVIQATDHSMFSTGLFLEQAKTSEIFLERLKELGVFVEYGWELLDTKVVEGGPGEEEYVETTIRRALVGGNVVEGEDRVLGDIDMRSEQKDKEYETQVVRSKYLVACDGGRSTVRHKINVAFPGRTLPQKTLMWDGHCDCDIPLSGLTAVRGPNGKTMMVFPMSDGVVRIGVEDVDMVPGEDFEQTLRELTIEHFESVVAETAYPAKFKVKSTIWLTAFKTNERRAERYVHKNRIFLAGDAAHVHSPAGGQGLNTGLHDAHNLAWKLGYVLNGLAKPEFLLPTYEERGAMADRAIRLSSKLLTRRLAKGLWADLKAYLFFLVGPFIIKVFGSFLFAPEVAMLDVEYEKNNLNRPHKTQPEPKGDYKVGVRAKDGILLPFYSSSLATDAKEKNDPQPTLRLHSLFTGIARFHILVFASDALNTSGAKEISTLLDRHVSQWQSKYTYASTLQDGYADKDLFKVHVIAGPSSTASSSPAILEMSKRGVGKGKVFVDKAGQTHQKYGFAATKGLGGITVIRPDSHVGFRVHGVNEQAWKDVDEYFSTVLVAHSE